MTTYTFDGDDVYVEDPPYHYDQHSLGMVGDGSVLVEAQFPGSEAWRPVPNTPLTSGQEVRFQGVVDKFRFTVSGSTGPVSVMAFGSGGGSGVDYQPAQVLAAPSPLMARGGEAFITQPYTEANVKRGLEFYIRTGYPTADPIAGGQSRKLYFQTGAKQVLVKLREFEYIGEELQIELFSSPTGVTGGTPITVNNWNAVNPVATTVTVTKDVTTTDDGTPLEGEPEYFFGASNANFRDPGSIPIGRERILPANSTFLVVITNNNGADARCQYFLDWFEGDTDISP